MQVISYHISSGAWEIHIKKTVDTYPAFKKRMKGEKYQRTYMRSHYAVGFTKSEGTESKNIDRKDSIRNAFNSPLRPFVLATTSIGQEGLDFHQYCRKIMHWNLPSNPIDLEQLQNEIEACEKKLTEFVEQKEVLDSINLEDKATGHTVNGDIINYQVSHVWGKTKNPILFEAVWNICFVPRIIDPFTGHECKGGWNEDFIPKFKEHVYSSFENIIEDYNQFISDNDVQNKIRNYVKELRKTGNYDLKLVGRFEEDALKEWQQISC